MRFLLISLLTLFVYANADEIQRIESIVNDINTLRDNYEKSQDDLSLALVRLKDEKDKNSILLHQLKIAEDKSQKLENKLNILEKKYNKKVSLTVVKRDNENKFPQLQMKEGEISHQVIETAAHAFRLNKDAIIYDAQDGNIVAEWEDRTSFTSNQKSGSWIKITGYFVDKVWQKSLEELWVKEEDTRQRN